MYFLVPAQTFKSLYFPDFPGAGRRNFKIAFGKHDSDVFGAVNCLSSYEVRQILRHDCFRDLTAAASSERLAVNTYCVREVRHWYANKQAAANQLPLPHFDDAEIHSTFRAGKLSPLHRWYPFLEGYSPSFVEQILTRFAPEAKVVLDPFGGVGTTPLEAARLGKTAYYCEVNPLLQFLIGAKVRALVLPLRERQRIGVALNGVAKTVRALLSKTEPDRGLRQAYELTFGESKFFEGTDFKAILQIRTLLDELSGDDPAVAEFATIAALISLVPSSNLRRAGDLRFRRGKEFDDREDFVPLFQRHAKVVAEDLVAAKSIDSVPILLAADAKRLGDLPPMSIDAVVTSPPYLNGTNYFRNTKIELWFLRSVMSGGDLSIFRRHAITAGINDVVRDKPISSHPAVQETVDQLQRDAYDRRIPQMVGSYFFDMERWLSGMSRHLRAGALLAVDIGDSIYGGVHVPTDRLFIAVAKRTGFSLEHSIPLRTRSSRDKSALKQVLLTFRFESSTANSPSEGPRGWRSAWGRFKATLPHQGQPFAKRNWGHSLHSLCSYQGKMKPSLAHHLIQTFVRPGGRLLDPFAGVGTIPFEAALYGVSGYGLEISPAALVIAQAKLSHPDSSGVESLLNHLECFVSEGSFVRKELLAASAIQFNSSLAEYFHPKTFKEILTARRFFIENPPTTPSARLVMACLLHILHGNRPYALSRRSHPITPFAPTGRMEYRALGPRLREKVRRALAEPLPAEFVEGYVFECDATQWWPQEIDGLDAIITSPPFFDSTRFHLANWMRLWFAGWEKEHFSGRPRSFVDERQKTSFRVYEPIFRQARERLKKGGVVVFHLGLSAKCNMAEEIIKVASPWFRVADRFRESVEHCESHGIRDKGTVKAHDILVLE